MRKIAASLGGGGVAGFFFWGGGMKRVPVRKKNHTQ